MQRSYILVALAGLAIGAFIVVYIYPVKPQDFISLAEQAGKIVQDGFAKIAAWWSGLPDIAHTLMLAGIPVMVSVFLAWTKNRAVQKAEQTQRELQQQQLTFQQQMYTLNQAKSTAETQVVGLQQQLQSAQSSMNPELLQEAQSLVTQKNAEIDRLSAQIRGYQDLLEQWKLKVRETTVVK
jgi:hypothetical protein